MTEKMRQGLGCGLDVIGCGTGIVVRDDRSLSHLILRDRLGSGIDDVRITYMKDIFTGDIFEKIEPPHNVSFKIVGTALPTNQDMYFVAKWHEIFERYTSARLFVRKAHF